MAVFPGTLICIARNNELLINGVTYYGYEFVLKADTVVGRGTLHLIVKVKDKFALGSEYPITVTV